MDAGAREPDERLTDAGRSGVRSQVHAAIEEEWRDFASCRGLSLDLFFPSDEQAGRLVAKHVCRGCPVHRECLEYALRHGIEHGVWGGTIELERRHMRRFPWRAAPREA